MRLINYDQIQHIERRINYLLDEEFEDEWINSSQV
jgi:hypothetical protein